MLYQRESRVPLRILMILQMPWSRDLGGPRVSVELADEYRSRGHIVDKFDIDDAFPKRTKLTNAFGTALFHKRALAYVRNHGLHYDVIQAEQGNLPYSKLALKFPGLLVAHSSGLAHFHDRVLQTFAKASKPKVSIRYLKQSIQQFLARQISGGLSAIEHSFDYADRIIVINRDELNYVETSLGYGKKAVFLPNGISDHRIKTIYASAAAAELRLSEQQVVFIGRWSEPKGSGDFPMLIRKIRLSRPNAQFLLLGTGFPEAVVTSYFQTEDRSSIRVVPAFRSEELPSLLSKCTAGIFPSYTEGFGIGVLEKLASGIPCVSYDIPGPREMLSQIRPQLMVPVGNVEAMANRVVSVLRMPTVEYAALSSKCASAAASFRWKEIAERTLQIYYEGLAEISSSRTGMHA